MRTRELFLGKTKFLKRNIDMQPDFIKNTRMIIEESAIKTNNKNEEEIIFKTLDFSNIDNGIHKIVQKIGNFNPSESTIIEIFNYNLPQEEINSNINYCIDYLTKEEKLKLEEILQDTNSSFYYSKNPLENFSQLYLNKNSHQKIFDCKKVKKKFHSKNQEDFLNCLKDKNLVFLNTSQLKKIENKNLKRKYGADCIRKKIKVNHLKFLKYELKNYLKDPKKAFASYLTSNIGLEYNKKLYFTSLRKFLEDHNYLFKYKPKTLFERIENDLNNFFKYLNLDLFTFFRNNYFGSEMHKNQLKNIQEKNNLIYYMQYKSYDSNFFDYFENEKPNKLRIDVGLKKPTKN